MTYSYPFIGRWAAIWAHRNMLPHGGKEVILKAMYALLWSVALPLGVPYLLLSGRGLRERLGIWGKGLPAAPLWAHAASMGEVRAASAVVAWLLNFKPGVRVLFTTTSSTGRDLARRRWGCAYLAPLDHPLLVRRVLRNVRPRAVLLTEGELWPGTIREARRTGIPVALINGRISERTFRWYSRFGSIMRRVIGSLDLLCVQSQRDGERFLRLGARPERTFVVGNVKGGEPEGEPLKRDALRSSFGIHPERPVLVAGSTREGEEAVLLEGLEKLWARWPDLLVVLAPRHLERLGEVERLLKEHGVRYVLRSRMEGNLPQVLLVDTMGELTKFYAMADLAFVGGSFVPLGGHNPFEPASLGLPVTFGPHMRQEGWERLCEDGAAVMVHDAVEWAKVASRLLEDPDLRLKMGRKGQEHAARLREAARRTAELLISYGIV